MAAQHPSEQWIREFNRRVTVVYLVRQGWAKAAIARHVGMHQQDLNPMLRRAGKNAKVMQAVRMREQHNQKKLDQELDRYFERDINQ